jgi:putative flippase GtrA
VRHGTIETFGGAHAVIVRQFVMFSLVGVIGFVVDSATLYLAMTFCGAGLYSGRIISYLTTASSTWALNRRYTFSGRKSVHAFGEWGRFLAANTLGGMVNYGTYAILVSRYPLAAEWPIIGVAAGSIVGLAVNFLASRTVVFTERGADY